MQIVAKLLETSKEYDLIAMLIRAKTIMEASIPT
jgi:hypothetical protein